MNLKLVTEKDGGYRTYCDDCGQEVSPIVLGDAIEIWHVCPVITLHLTERQARKLSDTLGWVTDEGPLGEGWQSDELKELESTIDAQVWRQVGKR